MDDRERSVDNAIAEVVQPRHRPVVHARKPVADDVFVAVVERLQHRLGVRRFVRSVPVQHQHVLRFDVFQALADGLPLPDAALFDDARAVLRRHIARPVVGVTVHYEDVREALLAEAVDDFANRLSLIQRGDEHAHVLSVGHCRGNGYRGLKAQPFESVSVERGARTVSVEQLPGNP